MPCHDTLFRGRAHIQYVRLSASAESVEKASMIELTQTLDAPEPWNAMQSSRLETV
jgi:hypothetical protein